MSDPQPTLWSTMVTAPDDGRWFLVLRAAVLVGVGKPPRAIPDLLVLRRARSSPESSGYWESVHGHSVADCYVAGGMWADLDALPLKQLYARIEQGRLRHGGRPQPLPEPVV